MLLTTLSSSSPRIDVLSSLENLCTSPLSSFQPPYRNIKYFLVLQQIHSGTLVIRSSLALTPPDDFLDGFPTLDNIEEESHVDIDEKKSVKKVIANRVFFDKDLESYFDFNYEFKSIKSFKANQLESNDALSSQDSKAFICLKNQVVTSSIGYITERLIRILSGDILIPKQR